MNDPVFLGERKPFNRSYFLSYVVPEDYHDLYRKRLERDLVVEAYEQGYVLIPPLVETKVGSDQFADEYLLSGEGVPFNEAAWRLNAPIVEVPSFGPMLGRRKESPV